MRRARVVLIFLVAVVLWGCFAQGAFGETDTHTLPDTRVVGDRIEAETEKVSLEALTEMPGVSGVKRSHSTAEPVIRGLGWERVQTQVDGLPLYGTCPGRMGPPAIILQPETVQEAYVVKGVPSIGFGSTQESKTFSTRSTPTT